MRQCKGKVAGNTNRYLNTKESSSELLQEGFMLMPFLDDSSPATLLSRVISKQKLNLQVAGSTLCSTDQSRPR